MLLKRVAVGGMAELFLADDTSTNQQVVIKRILPYLSHEPEFVQMFLDEARIAAQLHQTNIIQVHELGKLQDSIFIAMEYVNGIDLRKILQEEAKLGLTVPYGIAAYVTAQVCAGLYYAHNAAGVDGKPLGVIHRDVSPQNVMVGFDGRIKLVDFGIAKAGALVERSKPGVIKGKFLYLSPEQLSQERIDHRADLFALGTMLYELTTGKSPFYKPTTEAVIYAIRSEEPPPPTLLRSDYPHELSRIVTKCMVKDRTKRYQQGNEIQQDLEAFLAASFPTDGNVLSMYIKRLLGTGDESTKVNLPAKKPAGRQDSTVPLPNRKAQAKAAAAAAAAAASIPPPVPDSDSDDDDKPASTVPLPKRQSSSPSTQAPEINAPRTASTLGRRPTSATGKPHGPMGEEVPTKHVGPDEIHRSMAISPPPVRKASSAKYLSAGASSEQSVTSPPESLDLLPAAPPIPEESQPDITLPPAPARTSDDDDDPEETLPLGSRARAAPAQKPRPEAPSLADAPPGDSGPVFDTTGSVPEPSQTADERHPRGVSGDEDMASSTEPQRVRRRANVEKEDPDEDSTTRGPASSRRTVTVLAVVAAVLVGLAIAGWAIWGRGAARPAEPPSTPPAEAAGSPSPPPETEPAPPDVVEDEAPAAHVAAPPPAADPPRALVVFSGPRGSTVTYDGKSVALGAQVEVRPGQVSYRYKCPGKRAELSGLARVEASAPPSPVHVSLACRSRR